jgi:hypothetical protein
MEERLREWKVHFNICDAAHLALQNVLVEFGFTFGQLPRDPHDEQSCVREKQCSNGQIMENWTPATTQAGCFIPPLLTVGDLQVMNVSETGSSSTIPPRNQLHVQQASPN